MAASPLIGRTHFDTQQNITQQVDNRQTGHYRQICPSFGRLYAKKLAATAS